MRWSSGKVRYGVSGKSQQMVGWGFASVGKHKRAASEERAKENLQSSISANIIKRSPNHIAPLVLPAFDWGRQACQSVSDHFGYAARA
jgi:hypothetical protein